MKSLGIWIVFLLAATAVNGQNYLLHAYESAQILKRSYDDEASFFRTRLTWQADDYAYYFTTRMRSALDRAESAAQGSALQRCAEVAANSCQEAIHSFDYALREIEADSTSLHLTVFEQLSLTNLHQDDLEMFYYYHSYRMMEASERLFDHHIMELGDRWFEMWFAYFDIAEELDECIANVLN